MRPWRLERRVGPCAAALFVVATAFAAPPVELADEGRTIVYRLQPGDTPADLARAFGLDQAALARLLEVHGASDWRNVRAGSTWKIPNPLAGPLEAATDRIAGAEAGRAAAEARVAALAGELAAAQAAVTMDAAARARLEDLERSRSRVVATVVALATAFLVSLGFLVRAQQRAGRAVRWARGLAAELEERRRAVLTERQQAARKLVELEERLRRYELAEAAARVRRAERQG